MEHNEAQKLIYPLIDGEIQGPQKQALLDHFNSCPHCREEYETALHMGTLFRKLPAKPLPAGFNERLNRKIQEIENEKPQNMLDWFFRWLLAGSGRAVMAAAFVVALLVGVFLIIGRLSPGSNQYLTLTYAGGPVEYFSKTRGAWSSPGKTTTLYPGDRIRTNSFRAVLVTVNGASIRLSSDTEIQLSATGSRNKVDTCLINLYRGRLWVDEGKADKVNVASGGYLIQPVGTMFSVSADNDSRQENQVEVFDGLIILNLDAQRSIDLDSGERFRSVNRKGVVTRRIERINPADLEQDEWYRWNMKVAPPVVRRPGVALSKPPLTKRPVKLLLSKGSGNLSRSSLYIPSSEGDWEKFKQDRRKWRTGRGNPVNTNRERLRNEFMKLPDESRKAIITRLKAKELLSAGYPPRATSLPGPVLDDPYFGKLMVAVLSASKPSQGNPEVFAALPLKKRMAIIKALKSRKVLPSTFPEDSKTLPPYAYSKIGRQWTNQGYHRLPSGGPQK